MATARRWFNRCLSNVHTVWILLFLAGVGVGMLVSSARFEHGAFAPAADNNVQEWWSGFFQNFSTEMFGAVITYVLIDRVINWRDRMWQLTRQMRNPTLGLARQAVLELQDLKALQDGLMRNGYFSGGYLAGAGFECADLQGARFEGANLQEAYFQGANLRGASFRKSNLKGADLREANLYGVCLEDAKLQGARLEGAILPDGVKWSDGMSMKRFTNRNHSRFYEPPDCEPPTNVEPAHCL